MNKIPDQIHWKLRDIEFNNIEVEFYPTTAGYQTCPTGFQDEMLLNDYLICCVKSGHCLFYKSSLNTRNSVRAYKVGPGECFMIPRNVICSYSVEGNEEWVNAWIAFSGAEVKQYLKNTDFANSPVMFTGTELYDEIYMLTERSYALQSIFVRSMYASSFLYKMIADLTQKSSGFISKNKINSYTEQTLTIMRQNHKVQISDIAAALNISREYLYKLFVQDIGKSPSQYLLDLRMEKACVLLAESDYSISTIASHMGFYDHASFTKQFREKFGISPKAFRETKK